MHSLNQVAWDDQWWGEPNWYADHSQATEQAAPIINAVSVSDRDPEGWAKIERRKAPTATTLGDYMPTQTRKINASTSKQRSVFTQLAQLDGSKGAELSA